MNIHKLFTVLALLLISPFVLADEMGTGAESGNDQAPSPPPDDEQQEPAPENEGSDLWQVLEDWID